MTRPEHYRSYSAVFPILLREGANGQEVLLHLRQKKPLQENHKQHSNIKHLHNSSLRLRQQQLLQVHVHG